MENKEQIIKWVIIGLIAVLLITFLNKIFGKSDKTDKDEKVIDDLKKILQKTHLPSFSIATYLNSANAIFSALFDGISEDEDAVIFQIKKMKNDLDILLLIEQFGHRRRQFTFSNTGLSEWLTAYLSKSDIKEINTDLQSKGIKILF